MRNLPVPSLSLIERLRQQGPEILPKLFAIRDLLSDEMSATTDPLTRGQHAVRIQRADELIDRVAGQRYATVSRLFWFTDWDAASAEAQRTGKPIISLRLLGDLTEDYSCANSRFFRTVLYANSAIAQRLRDDFILHWQSVRPVPRITVDFGDGRALRRTVTGNSIHYALLPDGTPLDGLPGLYGPGLFRQWLDDVYTLAAAMMSGEPDQRAGLLRNYHQDKKTEISSTWSKLLGELDPGPNGQQHAGEPTGEPPVEPAERPNAIQAGELALTKALTQRDVVELVTGLSASLRNRTDEAAWERMAQAWLPQCEIDASSVALIKRLESTGFDDGGADELIASLRASIALDSVRNEFLLHTQLHDLFLEGYLTSDVNVLNEKVYNDLFKTPRDDRWLGLLPEDVYLGLPGRGVVEPDDSP